MKPSQIFKGFSNTYCHSYSGSRTVEDIVEDLRYSLQFNDAPSFSDMQNGIVDCVGAAVITSLVLSHFFKDRTFFVVALPGVPWLHEDFWESKHTGVLEVLKNKNIRVIDSTPINGYGYGTITEYFTQRSLKKFGRGYKISPTLAFANVEEWERYIYPYFKRLSERDIASMLSIDHCRSSVSRESSYSALKHVPTGASGWAKDFFRLKARYFTKKNQTEKTREAFKKALRFTPNNVYLLREYGSFLSKNGQSQEATVVYFRAEKTKNVLIKQQKKIVASWKRHLIKLKKEEKWKQVAYYGGAIFWREQSNGLLDRGVTQDIKELNYKGIQTPLYRFSPGWFKKEGVSMGIVAASKAIRASFPQINIPTKASYGKRFRSSYVYKLPTRGKFKCIIGDKRMLKKMGCMFISQTPLEAHHVLTGMVQPEMLIT